MFNFGCLKESIHILKVAIDNGHGWHLHLRWYRAYGLSFLLMVVSNDIIPCQSDYSTLDMLLTCHDISDSTECEHITITSTPIQLVHVKQKVSHLS